MKSRRLVVIIINLFAEKSAVCAPIHTIPSATLTANGGSGMAFAAMFSGLGSAATAAASCTMIDSHNFDSGGAR